MDIPFKLSLLCKLRYSDGTFPVWYGSKTVETTIYETLYHALKFIKATEGWEQEEKIIKHRTVYDVRCDALMINLVGKEKLYPEIISNDYSITNKLGAHIKNAGIQGLISPSARQNTGENINIFKQEILNDPSLILNLRYVILLKNERIYVEGLNEPFELKI